MQNCGKLAGLTVFITGASRGIGKAIALKCAKDGANIVIAAKTADVNPKLPGTIYTAAKEVEASGGRCLPCVVDIRREDEVEKAVNESVKMFGGIDILVNNASAIHLSNTEETAMKKFDLMMGVNGRGTFLCSQKCLPYLRKGKNPHILNISPPLNLNPKWFKDHSAYTMAKYGMSMCALGMAEELKADGVAVNTLWPRTAIWTAAMEMLAGGEHAKAQCRTTSIVADAAYLILTQDPKRFSGKFCLDEDILRSEANITDFSQYSCVPGSPLLPDFFLDDVVGDPHQLLSSFRDATGDTRTSAGNGKLRVEGILRKIQRVLSEDLVKGIGGVFVFDLKDVGKWFVDLKNGSGATGYGEVPVGTVVNCTMSMNVDDFVKMFHGELNASSAFMSGKLKIRGDMGLALKLEKLLAEIKSKV